MKLLTVDEAAAILRIDKRTVRRLIHAGTLPALRAGVGINAPYRISEKALHGYIERESHKSAKAPAS